MGYIIPVNQYQYSQYADREVIKRYDPYRFVPIKPIKPPVNPPDLQQHRPIPIHNFKKTVRKNPQIQHKKVERLYGELTGKGLLYSDYA